MLLSKSIRITPTLVSATAARISGPSAVAGLEQQHRNLIVTSAVMSNGLSENASIQGNFIRFNMIAPGALTAVRFYADDTKPQTKSSTSTSSNAPAFNLPDREQVERFIFRVLALIWDISVWIYINTKRAIETYIVANDSVQLYWKRLHERMAKAKKEWHQYGGSI
ncbi:PREDICTED: uncharacterized protein LOC108362221 isoform X4 [Rhagoletis zephyria]|uniref:uncharacterized protein LOC108362221 isoform X4 n=2 Tax=Rhagoletis zephyria TaxID=28612 RepID=UPI0008116638|nr:PREDICTED: uncharacterized protein LOC108362221 isoform X4 [Rhagoletis zephyria]